jgi:hypothetical protein
MCDLALEPSRVGDIKKTPRYHNPKPKNMSVMTEATGKSNITEYETIVQILYRVIIYNKTIQYPKILIIN